MSRSHTGIMSTSCTTVTFIDSTRITTTNVSHPATRCTSNMTISTGKGVAMSRCRMGIMSTTCTMDAGTRLTASTTTNTDTDACNDLRVRPQPWYHAPACPSLRRFAFRSVRAGPISSYAYVTMAAVVIVSPLRASDS